MYTNEERKKESKTWDSQRKTNSGEQTLQPLGGNPQVGRLVNTAAREEANRRGHVRLVVSSLFPRRRRRIGASRPIGLSLPRMNPLASNPLHFGLYKRCEGGEQQRRRRIFLAMSCVPDVCGRSCCTNSNFPQRNPFADSSIPEALFL